MIYMDSLRKTREMELEVVYAGHGEPVEDHRSLIDERMTMHERRANKLYKLIAERPRNAYELAQEMWGNVAVTQAFLTLSEVLGSCGCADRRRPCEGARGGRRDELPSRLKQ